MVLTILVSKNGINPYAGGEDLAHLPVSAIIRRARLAICGVAREEIREDGNWEAGDQGLEALG
jgi:hypothetical protein